MSAQPFVLVNSEHGPLIANRLDYNSFNGGVYGVGAQIFSNGSYDPSEIQTVKALLRDLRTLRGPRIMALDCGANIGVHTVEMAKFMAGWGSVIGFEAQERIFYALAGNVAINNCFNASVRHAAVGAESSTMRAPVPDYTRPASFGSLELKLHDSTEFIGQSINYDERKMAEIPVVAIDDLKLLRVDFIKIDVEGMELEVLEGARVAIEFHHPTMIIEWIKSGKDSIVGFLRPLGYEVVESGGNLIATHTEINLRSN